MAAVAQLDINVEGIARALADRQLAVPIYQRSFAWQDENVRDLLLDIAAAIKDNANEYFLGSIVLTRRDDGKLEVVDGQQRLATISMIIGAVRDYFLGEHDEKRANQIDSKFLQQVDLKTLEATPQLRLNAYDDSFYRSRVLSKPSDAARSKKATRESHRRIDRAAKTIARFISDVLKITKTPIDDLIEWLDYLEKRAKVIVVEVPDDRHAWIIFETLNDRGLDLSISDLLKNYLFGMAEDRLLEVQTNWGEMLGALETVGDESTQLMYLRQVWASYHGLTRERELFNQVKQKINSRQRAVDFSKELAENAKCYAALLNPHSDFWNPFGDNARASVDVLLTLGLKQPRPLLLAIVATFDPSGVKNILNCIVSCSVRFTIVGQLGSSALENLYAETAQMVRDVKIHGPDDVTGYLSKKAPLDQEFQQAFALARVSSAVHARYYLRSLELTASGHKDPEFVPNANREHVNLEHVLPQGAQKENWAHFDEEHVELLCNRIGNLALLKLKKNSDLGNADFSKKREVYKESEFQLTREIANHGDWTPKEIEARQVKLAELAVKTWTIF